MTITRLIGRRVPAFLAQFMIPWLLAFALVFQGALATAHAHGLTRHGNNAASAVDSAEKSAKSDKSFKSDQPAKRGGPIVPLDDDCSCPICHVLQSGGMFVAAAAPSLLLPASATQPITAGIETRLPNHHVHSAQPRAPPPSH